MSRPSKLATLDACAVAESFRTGSVLPLDYLDFCLGQIASRNPFLNAVLDVYESSAREAAKAAQSRLKAGQPLSMMDGIPVGVKANIAVKGQVCHGGIKAYAQATAQEDAGVVKNLRDAGAVILGSLNMEEGALGAATDNPWFGKCQNPLKRGFTPGGSSGGSASAVAGGLFPVALGTDTMGSVRIPSAYCGIVGHKPSAGLVPIDGVMPLSTSLDTVGPHVRSVRDAAMILPILSGNTALTQVEPRSKITFACLHIQPDMDIEPDVQIIFDSAVAKISGHTGFKQIDDVLTDYNAGRVRRAGLLISEVEGAHYHVDQYERSPDGFSDHFQNLLSWGVRQPIAKLRGAYDAIGQAARDIEAALQTSDVIIAPTAPQTAFRFGEPIPAGQADFTALANFAGLPACSIPMGKGRRNMPLGLQVIGQRGEDASVLSVAAQISDLIN